MLTDDQNLRINEIRERLNRVSGGTWRNTMRRESASEVAQVINENGKPGVPICSQSVVNVETTPTAKDVICWMGPAAGEQGDDLFDASFIANAKSDVEWLLGLVDSLAVENAALKSKNFASDTDTTE